MQDSRPPPPPRSSGKQADGAQQYPQYQQKRRQAALERQKAARHEKQTAARSLATVATGVACSAMAEDAVTDSAHHQQRRQQEAEQQQGDHQQQQPLYGMDGLDPSSMSGSALRSYFASQLMTPEWLTDVPPDLPTSWLVMPRPEGKRCLVISSGGGTISRSRTGGMLHRFSSRLPGGGAGGGGGGFCVLDCIWQEAHLPQLPHKQQHQQDADMQCAAAAAAAAASSSSSGGGSALAGTYYIQDVLAWRSYSLVDCTAEFRLYWLASKLAEEAASSSSSTAPGGGAWSLNGGAPLPGHQCRFQLLPHWRATPEGLQAAATAGSTSPAAAAAAAGAPASGDSSAASSQSVVTFTQDGLYLRHAEGHYSLGCGSTPLALLWKDESCSRYLQDTDAAGVVPDHQQVVLTYQGPGEAGGNVATGDDPPVVLGRLPQEFVGAMGPSLLRPGRLLRFSLRGAGLLFNPRDGAPAGADLAYEGPANQRRGRADSLSKVVFQWQARRAPLRLPQLVAAAAAQQQSTQAGGCLAALADVMPAAAVATSSDAAMMAG